ncbi:acyltransferase family protein [Schumannella sp. 10F1B-5-1]|uniref:acyltransferase family protein n=1 Tax=Schumannella sp. 10F1B-5-1 TaxID=2590780 RepID=UPI00113194DA|nr:acyltransferase family protein [Schumannella sp. 10F1B-5-1]TPW70644.1 acyltransferase family protein [Schumannella sp. 10F1B-5-1]
MTTTADASAPAAAPKPKVRIPLWDNARWASVTLVVIGHAIQRQTADSDHALMLYLFIYAFHMPAFAIISGYFAKAEPPSGRQMRRLIGDLLVPYVVMQAIWTLVQWLVEGKESINPTQPLWTLWFLLALAIFRVVLPYLVQLRWPMLWATAFAVFVGYFDNVDSTFSLSRAIGIAPFFLLGWYLRKWPLVDWWRRASSTVVWGIRALAAGVFAAWFAVVVVNIAPFRDFDLRFWFFYDDSFSGLGEEEWWSGLLRFGLMLFAVLLSACFFAWMPRRETWFTGFGQATMYIYLLHSFILYPIRETGILKDEHASATWLVSMVLASIAISMLLASPFIRRVFRPIIEPRIDWLFRERDTRPPGRPRTDPTGSRRR